MIYFAVGGGVGLVLFTVPLQSRISGYFDVVEKEQGLGLGTVWSFSLDTFFCLYHASRFLDMLHQMSFLIERHTETGPWKERVIG